MQQAIKMPLENKTKQENPRQKQKEKKPKPQSTSMDYINENMETRDKLA